MTKKIVCLLFFLQISFNLFAQTKTDSLFVIFDVKWKNEKLELDKNYVSITDTLQINVCKFYLSNFQIQYEDGTTYDEKNSYRLIDVENIKPFYINHTKNKTISEIQFQVGIDSTASVSGALSGDLDLQNGMYWAWQSGYINFKLEGKSTSCKTRKNVFQFHIGGYLKPNYAIRKVKLKVNETHKKQLNIVMDLSKLFEDINLAQTNSIMIPGEKANKIADNFQNMFLIE